MSQCNRDLGPAHRLTDTHCPDCANLRDAAAAASRARDYYEITADDVGKPWIKVFGRVYLCSGFIGRILPQDVGKRIVQSDGILQVENMQQRAQRENRAGRE